MDYLRDGLVSNIITNVCFITLDEKKLLEFRKVNITPANEFAIMGKAYMHSPNTLIDNDYLHGQFIITTHFEEVPDQEILKIELSLSSYVLKRLPANLFEERPGNFSLPLMYSIKNQADISKAEWDFDIFSFNLKLASVLAASIDVEMVTDKKVEILPKGSIFLKIHGGLREHFNYAYTPNFFVLRSRYIRNGLSIGTIEYKSEFIRIEIINKTNKIVSIATSGYPFALVSMVIPSQVRLLLYTKFANYIRQIHGQEPIEDIIQYLEDKDENNNNKFISDFSPYYNDSKAIEIMRDIFGVDATIKKVKRKNKIANESLEQEFITI